MKRHFGNPGKTSGTTPGVQPQSHSLPSAYTTRADNIITLANHRPPRLSEDTPARPNSDRLTVDPLFIEEAPFDHCEFGSWVFTFLFFAAPTVAVTLGVIGYALYALLVSQPVEY